MRLRNTLNKQLLIHYTVRRNPHLLRVDPEGVLDISNYAEQFKLTPAAFLALLTDGEDGAVVRKYLRLVEERTVAVPAPAAALVETAFAPEVATDVEPEPVAEPEPAPGSEPEPTPTPALLPEAAPESWENEGRGKEFNPAGELLKRDAQQRKGFIEKTQIRESVKAHEAEVVAETGTVTGATIVDSKGQPTTKWSKEELLAYCAANNIPVTPEMEKSKNLIVRKIRGL